MSEVFRLRRSPRFARSKYDRDSGAGYAVHQLVRGLKEECTRRYRIWRPARDRRPDDRDRRGNLRERDCRSREARAM